MAIKRLEKGSVLSQSHFNLTDLTVNNINHIVPVQETAELDVTEADSIESKVLYVTFPGGFDDKYVCSFPNQCMRD